MNQQNTLYIVVPCYKEQEVLPETSKRLREKMNQLKREGKIGEKSRVMLSTTAPAITPGRSSASFTRRSRICSPASTFPATAAIRTRCMAGLLTAVNYADMIVSRDADLQDDINAVDEMVDDYHKGYDVVYGVRSKRDTDNLLQAFYRRGLL